MTKLEIACFNPTAALTAAREGADRIELCRNYSIGGITPEESTLETLKTHFSVPVYVMIRPRGGDFTYSKEELVIMKNNLLRLRAQGADGFVFGILTPGGHIDKHNNKILVDLADGLPCTFHRAFDQIVNKKEALEEVITCGFKTLLTSGGEHPAMEGLSVLKALKKQAGDRLTILVGGGIRSFNVQHFKDDFDFVHTASIRPGTEKIDTEELRALKNNLR